MSANTGVAPVWMTTLAVAQNVKGVVTTSSPAPTCDASSERCSAAVHEFTAMACVAPVYSANARSNAATRGPVESHPDSSALTTLAIASAPIAGGASGTTTCGLAIACRAAVVVRNAAEACRETGADGIRAMGDAMPLCNGDTTVRGGAR